MAAQDKNLEKLGQNVRDLFFAPPGWWWILNVILWGAFAGGMTLLGMVFPLLLEIDMGNFFSPLAAVLKLFAWVSKGQELQFVALTVSVGASLAFLGNVFRWCIEHGWKAPFLLTFKPQTLVDKHPGNEWDIRIANVLMWLILGAVLLPLIVRELTQAAVILGAVGGLCAAGVSQGVGRFMKALDYNSAPEPSNVVEQPQGSEREEQKVESSTAQRIYSELYAALFPKQEKEFRPLPQGLAADSLTAHALIVHFAGQPHNKSVRKIQQAIGGLQANHDGFLTAQDASFLGQLKQQSIDWGERETCFTGICAELVPPDVGMSDLSNVDNAIEKQFLKFEMNEVDSDSSTIKYLIGLAGDEGVGKVQRILNETETPNPNTQSVLQRLQPALQQQLAEGRQPRLLYAQQPFVAHPSVDEGVRNGGGAHKVKEERSPQQLRAERQAVFNQICRACCESNLVPQLASKINNAELEQQFAKLDIGHYQDMNAFLLRLTNNNPSFVTFELKKYSRECTDTLNANQKSVLTALQSAVEFVAPSPSM